MYYRIYFLSQLIFDRLLRKYLHKYRVDEERAAGGVFKIKKKKKNCDQLEKCSQSGGVKQNGIPENSVQLPSTQPILIIQLWESKETLVSWHVSSTGIRTMCWQHSSSGMETYHWECYTPEPWRLSHSPCYFTPKWSIPLYGESAHGPAVNRHGNAAWRKYSLPNAKGISSSCDITLSCNIYMCDYSSRCQPCAIQPPRSNMP